MLAAVTVAPLDEDVVTPPEMVAPDPDNAVPLDAQAPPVGAGRMENVAPFVLQVTTLTPPDIVSEVVIPSVVTTVCVAAVLVCLKSNFLLPEQLQDWLPPFVKLTVLLPEQTWLSTTVTGRVVCVTTSALHAAIVW